MSKYDIENDSYEDFSELDELIEEPMGYFINRTTNKLYIINTDSAMYERDTFICDLHTGYWAVLRNSLITYNDFYVKEPEFHYINDKIHILYQNRNKIHHHDIFDPLNNEFNEMVNKAFEMHGNTFCAVYLDDLNKFFCITGTLNREIWSLDMNNEGQTWKMCKDVEVPTELTKSGIKVVVPYNNILICFCKDNWEGIRCFDVVDKKWYIQPKIMYNMNMDKSYFIGTGGRYCYYYKDDGYPARHERIDLFDACPQKLQKQIQERTNIKNMRCCFGYCRRYERRLSMIIPDYLKRIVFRYFNDLPK